VQGLFIAVRPMQLSQGMSGHIFGKSSKRNDVYVAKHDKGSVLDLQLHTMLASILLVTTITKCFPAQDELSTSRTSLVSSEQPVLCIPVRLTNTTILTITQCNINTFEVHYDVILRIQRHLNIVRHDLQAQYVSACWLTGLGFRHT